VLDLEGEAKGLELALEFCAIICTYLSRVAKHLEHLLTQSIRYRRTALVVNQGEDAEFAEATDGAEDVSLAVFVAEVDDEVKRPLAAGASG
jgi:hypothetical protein